MAKPLILVGGGGHCKSVIEAAESAGMSIKGILDLSSEFGKKIVGYEVIGNDDDIPRFVDECEFVVTLGFIKNPAFRNKLHERIEEVGGKLATVIASTSHVSRHATIGPGTVVLHGAMVNAGAQISGHCHIGDRTLFGANSFIFQDKSIGSDCAIDALTYIDRDIEDKKLCTNNTGGLKIYKNRIF